MDYEREDRIATLRARAAIESQRRAAAGEPPFTIAQAADACGLDDPTQDDGTFHAVDLLRLRNVCDAWGILTDWDRA